MPERKHSFFQEVFPYKAGVKLKEGVGTEATLCPVGGGELLRQLTITETIIGNENPEGSALCLYPCQPLIHIILPDALIVNSVKNENEQWDNVMYHNLRLSTSRSRKNTNSLN